MTRGRVLVGAAIATAVAAGAVTLASGQQVATYSGLGSQRLPFILSVAGDGRTLSLDVTWRASCGDVVRTIRRAATTIAANGELAWTGTHVNPGDDGDEDRQRLRLTGRVESDGTLTGVWVGERDAYNGEGRSVDRTCATGDVAFRVAPGAGTTQPVPRRDLTGHLVVALEEVPDHVAAGDGKVWVRSHGPRLDGAGAAPQTLTAFDASTAGASAPIRLGDVSDDQQLVAGEGAAWLLTRFSPVGLLRIDARTQRVTRTPRLGRNTPVGIAAGAGGVWVLTLDRVLRLDPRSGRIARSIRLRPDRRAVPYRRCTHPTDPELISVHGDDVWITTRTFLRCRLHASPRAFALARKGPFYSLVRIDPRANRIAKAVTLSREYMAIAAGASGVWGVGCATVPQPGRLACPRLAVHRFDLRSGRPAVAVALPVAASGLAGFEVISGLGVSSVAIWVVQQTASTPGDPEPPGVLRRIDIATRKIADVRALPRLPADLTAGDDGVWALDGEDRTLIRVEP
jgi:hypothetical protein